jgi:competence protein ComEC
MNLKLFLLITILLLLLGFRFATQEKNEYRDEENVMITARLLSMPEQKGRVQSFSLRPKNYEPVYISAPLFPEYSYGQILTVSGKLKLSNGEKKTFPTMSYPKITVKENDSLSYRLIAFIREKVMGIYSETLPNTGASLLMGIVFGIKQGMPEEFKDALSETGVTHVVAASGMNVTLIAGAFMVIFGYFLKRQLALILSIVGIFSYALLAGMEPSILRASIMGSIVFLSGILGRQNVALWTLGLTGYLMLLWQPGLIGDVGFQLSFLATLGILVIIPVMNRPQKAEKSSDDNLVIQDLKTTLAAQLGTLPILLSAFGQVSFLSIIVNMLVLWTIPILMFIGSVSAIVGLVYEPFGKLLAIFALPFLLYFEWIVMLFSEFDLNLTVESLPWQVGVVYYLILFSVAVWMRKKRIKNQELRIKAKKPLIHNS